MGARLSVRPTFAAPSLQPPATTWRALPPVVTATARPVPPFLPPPVPPSTSRSMTPERTPSPIRTRSLDRRTQPATTGPDADRQHQIERIAGSLEEVARLLRTRGVSALFRRDPDPLGQRLLSVIADDVVTHEFG